MSLIFLIKFCILEQILLDCLVKGSEDAVPFLQEIFVPRNLNENQTIKLNCDLIQGKQPTSLEWHFNNEKLEDNDKYKIRMTDDSSSLTIKSLSIDDLGEYSCLASNQFGQHKRHGSVFVNTKPIWTKEPKNLTSNLYKDLVLECDAKAYPQPQVTWIRLSQDERSIIEEFKSNIVRLNLNRDNAAFYRCTASNIIGTINKTIYVGYFISKSVLSVELQEICAEDTFEYGDYEVNSVHLVKKYVYLKSMAWFAINETFEYFHNKSEGDELLKVKKEYNRILTTLYSERFLNQNLSSQSFDELANKTKQIHTKLQQLYRENSVQNEYQKISSIRDKVPRTINLIDFLSSFYDSKLPKKNYINDEKFLNDEFDCDLKSILENLRMYDNQKFVFADEFIDDIEDKQIISRPKFYLSRYSKLFFDFRSTGRLEFSIVLPFDNQNSTNYNQNSTICLEAADLPEFYQNKDYEF